MRRKSARKYYPRLPDAVQNLLALHSLVAIPTKRREFVRGASTGWNFYVYPEKIELGKPRQVVFILRNTAPLENWVKAVDMYVSHKANGRRWIYDFETDLANIEKRMNDSFRYACSPCSKKP